MVKKYINMQECDIQKERSTVQRREHENAVKKLLGRATQVQALRVVGLSIIENSVKASWSLFVKMYSSGNRKD